MHIREQKAIHFRCLKKPPLSNLKVKALVHRMNFKGILPQKIVVAYVCLSKFDSKKKLDGAKKQGRKRSKPFIDRVI